MAEDGYIEIVDRRKDMIISGGFNVYPNEVEQVITEITAVQECAVIGVPDEKWGEAVKGVVQLKAGAELNESELIAYVKDKLGSVKAPKTIDFVDELPKSPVGKVLKTELRDQYWTPHEQSRELTGKKSNMKQNCYIAGVDMTPFGKHLDRSLKSLAGRSG